MAKVKSAPVFSQVDEFAKSISTMWVRAAATFIAIGRKLLEADETLSGSDFTALIGRPGKSGNCHFRTVSLGS
jgi:hypothetical protein